MSCSYVCIIQRSSWWVASSEYNGAWPGFLSIGFCFNWPLSKLPNLLMAWIQTWIAPLANQCHMRRWSIYIYTEYVPMAAESQFLFPVTFPAESAQRTQTKQQLRKRANLTTSFSLRSNKGTFSIYMTRVKFSLFKTINAIKLNHSPIASCPVYSNPAIHLQVLDHKILMEYFLERYWKNWFITADQKPLSLGNPC